MLFNKYLIKQSMKLNKSSHFKTLALTGFIFVFSLFGFTIASGYGGVGGGKPPVPKIVTAINYPMTLSYGQEGTATNNFGQQGTVKLEIPKGAVGESTKATFKIQMSAASANQKPAGDSYVIGGKVFNITAKDENNNDVTGFNKDLTITIILPDMPGDVAGVDVYYFDSETNKWVKIQGTEFDLTSGKVVFSVNHLSIFAVMYGDSQDSIAIAKEQRKELAPETEDSDDEPETAVISEVGSYADGALIRGKNKKIYVIKNGVKQHIKNLLELREYAGQLICDVDDAVLAQYGEAYGDGALIRGKNMKIYIIANGKCKHIANLAQLAKYAGREIFNITYEVMDSFEIVE